MVVDSDQLPWKGGLGPAFSGTQYWSKWKWSGLESINMSDSKKTVVCMSPISPIEYSQVRSTKEQKSIDHNHQVRKFEINFMNLY